MCALREVSNVVNLGMFAIRADRDYVIEEDLFKATRKIKEGKKLESKLEY